MRGGLPCARVCVFSTLRVSDKMGNRCMAGGAPIVVSTDSNDAQSNCIDNGDGSYSLHWKSTRAGTYKTHVKIDGVHVIGSPTTMKMFAGSPDVPRCEIDGKGLKTALAGQAAIVSIACKDQFANKLSGSSLQGQQLFFGLALLPAEQGRQALRTHEMASNVQSMPFEGKWVKLENEEPDSEGKYYEVFEIAYTAKEAGDFELCVWCDPDGSGTRQWLTGSPFPVRVTGVQPSCEGESHA
jgi:hypothetical protein